MERINARATYDNLVILVMAMVVWSASAAAWLAASR
jgi:hypothetical protein